MLWWTILAVTAGTFKHRFVDGGLLRLNKISGAVIGVSGAAVLATVLYRVLES
jgi:hypothetical protein